MSQARLMALASSNATGRMKYIVKINSLIILFQVLGAAHQLLGGRGRPQRGSETRHVAFALPPQLHRRAPGERGALPDAVRRRGRHHRRRQPAHRRRPQTQPTAAGRFGHSHR